MKLSRTISAIALAAALTTGAQAADYSAPSSSSFDWDGFYAGVGIAGSFFNGGNRVMQGEIEAGVNFTSGDILFGVEAFVGYGYESVAALWGGMAGAEARVGYLMTPEALLYLSGGAVATAPNTLYGTIGAGAEFALTSDMTLDLEYKFLYNNATTYGSEVGASLLWHF